MVHMRHGTMTHPSSVKRRDWDIDIEESQGEDPLDDTVSLTPSPVAPIKAHALYVEPTLIAQLVRAVIKNIHDAPTSTPTTALVMPPAPVITTPIDNMVALVRIVKCMREMGYKPLLADQDAEVDGR